MRSAYAVSLWKKVGDHSLKTYFRLSATFKIFGRTSVSTELPHRHDLAVEGFNGSIDMGLDHFDVQSATRDKAPQND